MSQIKKKFIGNNEVGATKVRLENNSSLKARNAADSADVNILKVNATDELIVEQNFIPVTPDTTKLGNDNKAFGELHVNDIKDNIGGAAIGVNSRVIYDTSGNNSVDAGTRILIDSLSSNSIDYENRTLKASTGTTNFDFANANPRAEGNFEVRGNGTNARSLILKEGNNTAGVSIKAPDTLAGDYTLTMPADDGTSGQVLQTDGSGILSWVTPSGGGGTYATEIFVLGAGDITNQYITLANSAIAGSVHFAVRGAPVMFEGASYDYSVSGAQVNFLNDIATGGPSALVAGDIVQVKYAY